MVKEISYDEIGTEIENSAKLGRPLVIDFWAPWCGPCRALSPIVDEVSEEMGDKVTFAKIDVEENGEAALDYSVMSIPTLIVFKDGKEAHRIVGSLPKHSLIEELQAVIG